ncbi:glutamyl-tRNA synthetase [Crucibulum laeve]|uniref:Glutamyl-tRNA synthetase n=1 Tax=Crucibulum laeve TaxID=68775 RepID=A0A5C3M0T8_9AGAR|nr:glutamyl-tRNA synthetase [Crucibulum laeve]
MALYNYMYARKHAGKWILRVEDTDATRYVPGAVDGIRSALEWAGLNYDHGPGKDGPHAPYFQSQRLDLYRSYANKLLDSGHAYRCFCSADRLQETREKLARSGSNSTYDKRCLHLTEEDVARRVKAGEKSIVRLNNSNLPNRPAPVDLVFGNVRDAHASLSTDPILLKTDLFPTYHLASVVDDHEMGITHVLRGEEWLPSLPLHLDLYAALRLTPPNFAHFPILLNPDGSKMSKRNGDVQVIDYIRRGWEPSAVLNWLALAGWGARHESPTSPISTSHSHGKLVQGAPDSTTYMSMSDLIDNFDITAMTHRSSSLDPAKLEFLNKHHLTRLWSSEAGLTELAEKGLWKVKEAFPESEYATVNYIKDVIVLLDGRLTNIFDIPKHAPYMFQEPDLSNQQTQSVFKKVDPKEMAAMLDSVKEHVAKLSVDEWGRPSLLDILKKEQEKAILAPKSFMKILRHILTGMKDGPAIVDTMALLGKERTLERLKPYKFESA